MKTFVSRKSQVAGNAIMTVLIICSILGFSVMGYLTVIEQQHLLSARSQAWNMAIAIVEAGIEDGLQHLNNNRTNLLTDGWAYDGGRFVRTNTFPDGNLYRASIIVTNSSRPVIISQAYAHAPIFFRSASSLFASVGLSTDQSKWVTRAVQAYTYKGGMFRGAMAARRQINLNGNDVLTDSFDSSDPTYSTGHMYDPKKAKDNGDVLSNDSVVNTINVGNANIYGHVATGPGGTVAINQGGVGEHSWQAANKGFQPGWVSQDANFTFPEVTLPYTSGLTPASGNIVETSLQIITNNSSGTTWPNPPPWDGVNTNIVDYTTVDNYPNPPKLQTVTNVTTLSSFSVYPTVPAGTPITTNITWVLNSATYPNPVPPSPPAIKTNTIKIDNSSTYPVPTPAGVTTNYILKHVNKDTYPAPGTYYGAVTPHGNEWEYDLIIGRTYNYNTFTFDYPKFEYRWPKYSYTYPNFSYSYHLFQTNVLYHTNFYDNILYTGNYYMNSLSGKTIVLGNANLVVANGIAMSGNDLFKVGPNGSVQVYSGGTSCTVGGNGVVNESGYAANFVLWCTDTVKNLAFNGNGSIIGCVVACNADTSLNGTGNSVLVDFTGCLLVNSVKMNGHFNFHYDEALGKIANGGRYLVTSWDEIPAKLF